MKFYEEFYDFMKNRGILWNFMFFMKVGALNLWRIILQKLGKIKENPLFLNENFLVKRVVWYNERVTELKNKAGLPLS